MCYNLAVLKQFGRVVALGLLGLFIHGQVNAQTDTLAFLSPPETSEFPLISAYLDLRDTQGNFLPGLQPQDFTINEDGIEFPATGIAEVGTSIQFVLAVNTATSFAIIDEQGIKRYDYISDNLQSWAERVSNTAGDELSLVTPSGVSSIHESDYTQWLESFQDFLPNFQTAAPSLKVLTSALDLAIEPGLNSSASRVVLWLTPTLSPNFNADLITLEQRALQSGVRVFVWMIDSKALFRSEQAITLRAFAERTGGQFFAFSGLEAIPDLEASLDRARQVYRLSYLSKVKEAGAHEVFVSIQTGDTLIATAPQSFGIELQPPSPVINALPAQITRTLEDANQDVGELEPSEVTVEFSVQFLDNIPREISRSALFVDGEMVAENSSPPFELFIWTLTRFTKSQRVLLEVQVEDELGLIGISPKVPVQIVVQGIPQGIQALFARFGSTLVVSIVLVAAAVLLLVLLLAGRIQPKPLGARRRRRSVLDDPVTQPLKDVKQEKSKPQPPGFLARMAKRISFPRPPSLPKRVDSDPLAYLMPYNDASEPKEIDLIPLTSNNITLGSDAQQAFVPIDDPAVEPIHARLWRDQEGIFRLADENSVAGTWINYAPVSKGGSRIENGDLIHIGQAGFRFTINKPGKPQKPTVILEKPKQ